MNGLGAVVADGAAPSVVVGVVSVGAVGTRIAMLVLYASPYGDEREDCPCPARGSEGHLRER